MIEDNKKNLSSSERKKFQDQLIRKKEAFPIVGMKNSKFMQLVKEGVLPQPIYLSGFSQPLFSKNELQNWIEQQKQNRGKNE